ncbi:MAG: hypothetical protein KAT68_12460 [Bacteroidales bacterium]|nr:hypothetical protein [Bacteroidales bacterium]
MKTSISNLIFGIIIILFVKSANSQDIMSKYGTDSAQCVRNLSLYTEFYKQKNYKDAYEPWKKAYAICPKITKNLFVHGPTLVKYKIKKEKNPELKEKLIDTLLMIYDNRIIYYPKHEGLALGRKGNDLFKFRTDKYNEAYELIKKSIEIRGEKSEPMVICQFMQTTVLKFKQDSFPKENVVENYSKSISILEKKLAKATKDKNKEKMKNGIANVEELFSKSGAADCEALINLFTTKFEKSPEDIELLKKIITLLDKTECTDSDLFLKTSEQLNKLEPSAFSAHNIARMYLKRADYNNSSIYYKQAIELEEDSLNLAKCCYELATLTHAKGGQPELARSYAYKSINYNPNYGYSYILIGKIYAADAQNCGENDFEHAAVYWVAVDKFIRAKNVDPSIAEEANSEIATYSQYFPDKEMAFFHGHNEGGTYTVGCWINETTKIRFK